MFVDLNNETEAMKEIIGLLKGIMDLQTGTKEITCVAEGFWDSLHA